ncbi:leucine-rich repeat-containing protein 70 [Sphaerodactylus townsendi]|uniref:leucine-rich repeat-containing protein 70 n=1 Tax=Sphaerodactylus townsendi TaxID=933632 RepID=UPI00202640C0|nr:leucine-rich repeat-containing protein 70 [Sphaerodactylus townsendi]XP_048359933.1 leucine-rich repeat-containing protein 70 [Sphaerodactylus townsendi]
MIGRITVQEMGRLHHFGLFRHILNCLLLLLIQEEMLCCPSVCQYCTGRQADCHNSGLSSVPKNFSQSTVFLYLSGNNITCINPNELIGLHHLAVLHLDHSGILNVHPKAFSECQKLQYLHMYKNRIKHLDPGTFEGLPNLRSLYLQNNEIAFVPRGLFGDLTSVQYLMLQSNRISILGSDTFLGMINLRILNLANNKISRISTSVFHHLDSLTYLYLDGNNLTCVPSNAFVALSNLVKLSLSHNPIGSIPPFAFKGLNKLKYLSLKRASINIIEANGFGGLNHLKMLILSSNNLENVNSSTFALLSNLMFLQLDRNKIINIAVDAFAKMGSSLKMLNLAFNNLTDIQPGLLRPLVSLTHLQAKYNSWNCSCRLLGLITWLASSSVSVNIHCQYPSNLHRRHLNYIKRGLFPRCFNRSTSPETLKNIKPTGIHQNTTTLLMAWNKNSSSSTVYKHLKNIDTEIVTLWTEIPTTSASQHLHKERSAGKLRLAATVFSLLTMKIPAQIIPVNFTLEENRSLPPETDSESFKTSLICTQQVEKLTRAFDILLTFFILACAVIVFLIYKMIQFRQKLKMQESSDSGIEYYGFYQAGRYHVTDPLQSVPQNPLGSSELDNIQPPKTTVVESQAQVILFEHSSL